jgi:hypothetical protein
MGLKQRSYDVVVGRSYVDCACIAALDRHSLNRIMLYRPCGDEHRAAIETAIRQRDGRT